MLPWRAPRPAPVAVTPAPPPRPAEPLLTSLVHLAFLLVAVVVVLSAYLRLSTFGLGCAPWPQCYGELGEALAAGEQAGTLVPGHWAGLAHRFIASLLGLVVLALALRALRRPGPVTRWAPWSLLALTVFLAWLGYSTPSPQYPIVALANLAGGFAMLGLLAWMSARLQPPPGQGVGLAAGALGLLGLQVLLGAWVSANFAATACDGWLACGGRWLPAAHWGAAFDPARALSIHAGRVLPGPEQALQLALHRYGGWLVALVLAATGAAALKAGRRAAGWSLLAGGVLEVALAYTALAVRLPVALVVAHNALAAYLVVVLVRLLPLRHEGGP